MAKKDVSAAVVEEVQAPVTPVVFGEGGDTQTGSGNKTPNVRNGGKKSTGGSVQGANLQTVTTVGAFKDEKGELHKDTLPQENDDKKVNRYLQRGLQNGDILSEDKKKSLYAERMVNEGKQFQPSKAVVNPFPATGSAYLDLLRQQGQFNGKSQNQPKPQDGGSQNQPNGGSQNQPNGGSQNQPNGGSQNQPNGGSEV